MDIQRNVKIKSETADTERIGFLHSLKAKILLLVAAAVVLTVVLNLWTVIPKSSSNISELTSNYMLDVAMVAGEGIDNQIRMSSYDSVMSGGNLSRIVGNVEIKGVKDSYTYIVDGDGTMLYHPTADKIGKPVENSVVKGVISKLKSENRPQPEVVQYNFNGETGNGGVEQFLYNCHDQVDITLQTLQDVHLENSTRYLAESKEICPEKIEMYSNDEITEKLNQKDDGIVFSSHHDTGNGNNCFCRRQNKNRKFDSKRQ